MKKLTFLLAAFLIAAISLTAQDTLKRGDFLVISNPDSSFYVMQENEYANGVYDLVNVSTDSVRLRDYLKIAYLTSVGQEGENLSKARRNAKNANQLRWLIRQLDTIIVNDVSEQTYASNLGKSFVLVESGNRTRLEFNDRYVARVDEDRYRLTVLSISNLILRLPNGENVQLTTDVITNSSMRWEGVDSNGDRVILRSIKR